MGNYGGPKISPPGKVDEKHSAWRVLQPLLNERRKEKKKKTRTKKC